MSHTPIHHILWSCVKDGPQEQESDIPWLISLLVHWRIWVWLFIWMIPFTAGMYAVQYTDPVLAVMVTWGAAALLSPYAIKVSPKYEISKNY